MKFKVQKRFLQVFWFVIIGMFVMTLNIHLGTEASPLSTGRILMDILLLMSVLVLVVMMSTERLSVERDGIYRETLIGRKRLCTYDEVLDIVMNPYFPKYISIKVNRKGSYSQRFYKIINRREQVEVHALPIDEFKAFSQAVADRMGITLVD